MEENKIKYYSLDEAREEIKKRWNDVELRRQVEEELGSKLIPFFDYNKPRSVIFRQLISPDNSFCFFYQESKYLNTTPTVVEYLDDIFVSFNEEKKGYGRLRVGSNFVDIIDFYNSEKLPLRDIVTLEGKSLVDFHHSLVKESAMDVDIFDMSSWFKSIGKSKDYYYPFLLHFLVHGVLFESFVSDQTDEKEFEFTKKVILPALERIKDKFGLSPLIVKMYPDEQTEEEDLYWWSYPPYINEKIIKYTKEMLLK